VAAMVDSELLQQLRNAFAEVAEMESLSDDRSPLPVEDLVRLAHSVRDANLEINRLYHDDVTEEQRQLSSDLEHRIRETGKGNLARGPLRPLAIRALNAFGWDL
jgi:hypothetical protein